MRHVNYIFVKNMVPYNIDYSRISGGLEYPQKAGAPIKDRHTRDDLLTVVLYTCPLGWQA